MSYVELGITSDLTALEVQEIVVDAVQRSASGPITVEILVHSGPHSEEDCGWDGEKEVGAMAHETE